MGKIYNMPHVSICTQELFGYMLIEAFPKEEYKNSKIPAQNKQCFHPIFI